MNVSFLYYEIEKDKYPEAEKTVVLTRLYAIDKKSVYTGFRKCFLMFLEKLNFLLIILI
jgi:hypothetical protein